MSLRQKINDNPKLGVGIGIGVLVVAIALILLLRGGGQNANTVPDQSLTMGFFSDDEGKTWFVDDLKKIPPFDHDGKKAYRAIVFHNGAGQRFCGRLEGYDDAQKKKLEPKMQENLQLPSRVLGDEKPMIKRPGKGSWLKVPAGGASPEYLDIINHPDPPSHNPDDAFGPPMVPTPEDIKAGSGTFAS